MARASCLAAVGIVALVLSARTPFGAWAVEPVVMLRSLEPSTQTLLDVTADRVPSGPALVVVKRWTLRPSPKALTVPPRDGPLFIQVESGDITATEAGTEHQLAVGEPFAPTDPHHEVDLRARGSQEAVAFVVYLHSGPDYPFPRDLLAHTLELFIYTPAEALPGGPGRLLLERLTLPPGSALPPQQAMPLMWTGVGAGVAGVTLEGEQMPVRWEAGQERTIQSGEPWPQVPNPVVNPLTSGGTWMTVRNAGDSPLILYRLTLMPSTGDVVATAKPLGGPPMF